MNPVPQRWEIQLWDEYNEDGQPVRGEVTYQTQNGEFPVGVEIGLVNP